MMHTEFRSGDQARSKLLTGVAQVADALRVTLGPRSRSVLIGKSWGTPEVCDDGVTIARTISLKDPVENIGAQMVRQAAMRTGDAVGDGTTTSTLLAHALYSEGLRNVVAGASALELRRALDDGAAIVIEALRGASRPVKTRQETAQIASISAHGDQAIGERVAEAIEKVGADGVVSVEEARTIETTLEVVEGMRFDRGYISPYFATDMAKMETVLEAPLILIHDKKISHMRELLPLLEQIAKSGRPLLIVAEDVDGEALATLVVNRLRGALACAAVKAPGFGERRMEMLKDLAILTGGQALTEDLGLRLENIGMEHLGSAKRVVIDSDSTTLIGGGGERKAIEGRCEQIRRQIAEAKADYDRTKLQERLAKLSGGVAVIRVGAPTESEMKGRKAAYEDAISACQAAVAEGIVTGGGVALLRASAAVERRAHEHEGDRRTGLKLLASALSVPIRQLALNSGHDPGVVAARVLEASGPLGFDAAKGEFCDLDQAGILDPLKVVRIALQNAVSVAGTLLLAEATLTEIPEKTPEAGEAPEAL